MPTLEAIAALVSDADVYELADSMGCDLVTARHTLMAEAYAKLAGIPIDYSLGLERLENPAQ